MSISLISDVSMMFASVGAALAHLKAERLRALAIGHLALTFGRLFVLFPARTVADVAGPGLFSGSRYGRQQ